MVVLSDLTMQKRISSWCDDETKTINNWIIGANPSDSFDASI